MSAEALLIWEQHAQHSVGGIMVSIAAFQAVDPGSIPGRRNIFLMSSDLSALQFLGPRTQKCFPGEDLFKKFSVTGN